MPKSVFVRHERTKTMGCMVQYIPLFSAPQQSQVRMVLTSPVEASRRLPHSVQKTSDPIADILSDL